MREVGIAIIMALLAGLATLLGAVLAIIFSKHMKPITFAAALAFAAGCTFMVAFGDIYREGLEHFDEMFSSSHEHKEEQISALAMMVVLAGWVLATVFDIILHASLDAYDSLKSHHLPHSHHTHLGLCAVDLPKSTECLHTMHIESEHSHKSDAAPSSAGFWSKVRHSTILRTITGSQGLSLEEENKLNEQFRADAESISRLGYFTAGVLAMHNIPEGIALYITATTDAKSGLGLAIAIAMHNLPQGMAIAVPLYIGSSTWLKPLLFATIAGLAQPVGALLGYAMVGAEPNDAVMAIMLLLTCGVLLNASIKELYASGIKYDRAGEVCAPCLFIGMLVMTGTIALLGSV